LIDEASIKEKIQIELSNFYDKLHNGKIKIIEARQGVGKTRQLENYCMRKGKDIIITSAEHEHLNEIEKNLRNKGFTNIHHIFGFEKICPVILEFKKNKDTKDLVDFKKKVIRMYNNKISPSLICKICNNCKLYREQFKPKKFKNNIVLMPFELLLYRKVPDCIDEIVIEEKMYNCESIIYPATQNKIDKLLQVNWKKIVDDYNKWVQIENNKIEIINESEIFKYNIKVNRYNNGKRNRLKHKIDFEIFIKDLEESKRIIENLFKELTKKFSVLNDIETSKNECIFFDAKKYGFWSFWKSIKITDLNYYEYTDKLNILLEKTEFGDNLDDLYYYCVEKESYYILEQIDLIKNHNRFFDRLDDTEEHKVSWNERVKKYLLKSEIGKIYGENEKALMNYYVPYIYKIFDLYQQRKNITIVCADFNNELFNTWISNYRISRITKLVNLINIDFDYFKSCFKIPKYKATLYHAKRSKTDSWSETSLNRLVKYEGKFIPYIEKFFEEQLKYLKDDNVGIISQKEYINKYFSDWTNHWYYGSGIAGSNKMTGKVLLILLWNPIPPRQAMIKKYLEIFGEYPPLHDDIKIKWDKESGEKIEVKIRNVFSKNICIINKGALIGYTDEKLNLVFNIENRDNIINAIHRTRDLYNPDVKILCCCPIPDKILEQFENSPIEIFDWDIFRIFNPDVWRQKVIEKRDELLVKIHIPEIINYLKDVGLADLTMITKGIKRNRNDTSNALDLGEKIGVFKKIPEDLEKGGVRFLYKLTDDNIQNPNIN